MFFLTEQYLLFTAWCLVSRAKSYNLYDALPNDVFA